MPKNENNKKINLSIPMPAVSSDGFQINTNNDTKEASIIFFQIAPFSENEAEIQAQAVSHVRMSLEQLEHLRTIIAEAIKNQQ